MRRLFLFDEPLSNLDAQLRDDMRVEIKRLHQELKRTMVYVTHDQIEAMTLADRIVLLRDGVIEQQGAPLDLFDRPKNRFVAGFLGSPKMNFIPATLTGNSAKLEDGTIFKITGPQGNGLILLGIRPQHIVRAAKAVQASHTYVSVPIDLVQVTGTRALVTVPLGGGSVIADLEVGPDCMPGSKIKLDFDTARMTIFDPQSGEVR